MRAATSSIPGDLLAAHWAFRHIRLPRANPKPGTFYFILFFPSFPLVLPRHASGTEKQHYHFQRRGTRSIDLTDAHTDPTKHRGRIIRYLWLGNLLILFVFVHVQFVI